MVVVVVIVVVVADVAVVQSDAQRVRAATVRGEFDGGRCVTIPHQLTVSTHSEGTNHNRVCGVTQM